MQKYEPSSKTRKNAHIGSIEDYKKLYEYSINNPEDFWAEQAERITWFKKWDKIWEWDFNKANITWFEGAKLNACYNCVDRHVDAGYGAKTALIWEGNNPDETRNYTYD
tara:strand:- start:235 stop:561 length:327 start_codon:yes stop_codon:yes gene_type:complete